MPRIILASQSPRRRQLLAQIGLTDFEILVPQADEGYDPAASDDPAALIIAADTMVFLGNLRLGKPRDQVDAYTMLSALSGRTHRVCTGVTLTRGGRTETRAETTAVTFRPLTEDEIWGYIRTGDPMDKAGSYGVQGRAALFVSGIQGDYFNVMGLPLHLLGRMLGDFGLDLFAEEVGR